MYYVSSFNKLTGMYGIMDTSDGVVEEYSKEDILKYFKKVKIEGVSGKTIKVYNASKVASTKFDKVAEMVKREIDDYGIDKCMELAKSIHFVKKIKGIDSIGEVRRITAEHVYPPSVKEVVDSASDYTNNVMEIPLNPQAIKNALMNNACLILQEKTNGALSAFICTGSLKVLDSIYMPSFFESVFLTKTLWGYTQDINKVKARPSEERPTNPDMLNVFSCSLRFRREGAHHDGALKELSSPFYTVNIPKVKAMFVLDNPEHLGDRILPEFAMTNRKDEYKFDFNMYQDIKKCIDDGTNYFGNEDMFMKYVNIGSLEKAVDLTDLINRFGEKFDYIEFIRSSGYSFNPN